MPYKNDVKLLFLFFKFNVLKRARICKGVNNTTGQKKSGKIAAFQEWADSWTSQVRDQNLKSLAPANPLTWKAVNLFTDKKTNRKRMNYRGMLSRFVP